MDIDIGERGNCCDAVVFVTERFGRYGGWNWRRRGHCDVGDRACSAPGAPLSFANAGSDLEMEQAVNSLAFGNDVVVDDLSFYEPSYDGASNVSTNTASALNNSANSIRAYITAAGNHALNHYSGTFTSSAVDGLAYTGQAGALHLFSGVPYTGPPEADVPAPAYQTIDTADLGNEPLTLC